MLARAQGKLQTWTTCLFFKHLKAVQEGDCRERHRICESPGFCKCAMVSRLPVNLSGSLR